MDEEKWEEFQNVIQYVTLKLGKLQERYRKETGREFVVSGPRKQPAFLSVLEHFSDRAW